MTDRRQPRGHIANSTRYKEQRRRYFEAQGRWGVCRLCGELVDMTLSGRFGKGPNVDHTQPTSDGGSWLDLSNWQLAHRSCNSAKGRGPASAPAEPMSPNG